MSRYSRARRAANREDRQDGAANRGLSRLAATLAADAFRTDDEDAGRDFIADEVPRYRYRGPIADEGIARRILEAAGATTWDIPENGVWAGGFGYSGLTPEAQFALRPYIRDGVMPPEDTLAACRGELPMPQQIVLECAAEAVRRRWRSPEG
jgi:hypothetical protein